MTPEQRRRILDATDRMPPEQVTLIMQWVTAAEILEGFHEPEQEPDREYVDMWVPDGAPVTVRVDNPMVAQMLFIRLLPETTSCPASELG